MIFILFFFIQSAFAQQMPFFAQPFLGHETYFLSFMGCFSIFYVILHQEIHLLKRERPFAQHATPYIKTLESDYSLYL